jgi:hypothetical protein
MIIHVNGLLDDDLLEWVIDIILDDSTQKEKRKKYLNFQSESNNLMNNTQSKKMID